MKEHPILFSAPMVRALLNGSKTQTRRVMKPQMVYGDVCGLFESWYLPKGKDGGILWPNAKAQILSMFPYGQTGSQLWVRETFYAFGRWVTQYSDKKKRDEWHFIDITQECGREYRYDASMLGDNGPRQRGSVTPQWWKRPAIFMPYVASRILLEIVSVRVERLRDISEADALSEGIDQDTCVPVAIYRELWESINGPGSWDVNPWVWVVEFKRTES